MEKSDFKHELSMILLSYYIKYSTLYNISDYIMQRSNNRFINVYIDIYDLVKKIYTMDIYSNNTLAITAGVINLAAHYRNYYKTRYGIWARIFLIYGREVTPNHRQFINTFGSHPDASSMNYSKINNMITTQLELVKIISAYINDVYFIDTNVDFSIYAYNIITNKDFNFSNENHIIITKNKYSYQIPALLNNAYVIRPSKYMAEDNSVLVDSNTVLSKYYSHISSEETEKKILELDPKALSLFMVLNGCKDKNVSALTNITRTTNMIYGFNLYRRNNSFNKLILDTKNIYSNLMNISTLIDYYTFDYRYKALDLIYQHMLFINMPESKDKSWIINLNDPNTIKDINNKYFANNQLDLNSL